MTDLTTMTPSARVLRHLDRGTLLRGSYGDGRETACLISAAWPPCAQAQSASVCPADVMPAWLAHLTPRIADYGSVEAWEPTMRRYAGLMSRWHVLDDAAWERAHRATKLAIVREARMHATREDVLAAIDGVIAWLDAGAPEADRERVSDAAADAAHAAHAAAAADADAAYAATDAADAATAYATAYAAACAAYAAGAPGATAYAPQKAWDRMAIEIFAAIEREIGA